MINKYENDFIRLLCGFIFGLKNDKIEQKHLDEVTKKVEVKYDATKISSFLTDLKNGKKYILDTITKELGYNNPKGLVEAASTLPPKKRSTIAAAMHKETKPAVINPKEKMQKKDNLDRKAKHKKPIVESGVMGLITPESLRMMQLAGISQPNVADDTTNSIQPLQDVSDIICCLEEKILDLNIVHFKLALSHLEDMVNDLRTYTNGTC